MKKFFEKTLFILLLIVAMAMFTACSSTVTDPEAPAVEEPTAVVEAPVAEEEPTAVVEEAPAAEEPTAAVEEAPAAVEEPTAVVEEPMAEVAMADALDINFAMGNNQRTLTYQQATPLELPDGTAITQGTMKPTWQYISEQMGFAINDVTIQDQSSGEMIDVSAATGFDGADIFGGSGIGDDLMSYGAQGYFVRLNDHMDMMPNFAAYLEANPNIAKAITAYDGGIYHIPYAAELGNYARTFNVRETWVTTLLDSADGLEAETATLTPVYEGYWDRNGTNVVDLQNEAAGGTLTQEVALSTLLAYIAETYPDLENPSDLYLGETAMYDIDELVALWRVVELSPNTLTKATTGSVIENAEIAPFYARRAVDRGDVLRLITYWGGQRVYGSDSYGAYFYTDADGQLQYSHAEDGFLEGIDYLSQLYAEGLIHSEFSDLSVSDNFRDSMYASDDEADHFQFGFSTIDWIASTTATNEDVVSILPPLTTVGSDEFIYFIENTRVIKPDGWAISTASSEEEINAALTLFDYFFTVDGNNVQNYGPPNVSQEVGGIFTGPDGIDYPKFTQWALDTACETKNCDISSFLRDYVGSQIPIGYQKEIGFEMQYTQNHGDEAWALYVDKPVLTTSYEAENPLFRLVPPVFSLTEQDTAKLGQVALGQDQIDQLYLYITGADTAPGSVEALKQMFLDAGLDEYIEVFRNAFARMSE